MKLIGTDQNYPIILPDDFAQYWFRSFRDAYGTSENPVSSPFGIELITPEALHKAYLLTWIVLWFQTSGEGLGCVASPPKEPKSSNCGECSWCNPSISGDNGTGTGPPEPTIETEIDASQGIIGIISAILGFLLFCTGGWITGAAAIALGITLANTSIDVKWDKLRCDIYFYRMYLYNGLKAIHELGSLGAVLYPFTNVLEQETQKYVLLKLEFTYDSGVKVVRSKISRN